MFKDISIIKKVFFLTAAMFCLYIVLTQLCQLVFYGKFYTYAMREELTKQVEEFAAEYEVMTDSEEINSKLVDVSNKNDTYMLVLGEHGNILYNASYEITLQTVKGEVIRLSVDNAVRDKEFNDLNIKVGDSINTIYYTMSNHNNESNVYIPMEIQKEGKLWKLNVNSIPPEIPTDRGMNDIRRKNVYNSVIIHPDGIFSGQMVVEENETETTTAALSGVVTSVTFPDRHNMQSSVRKAESAWAAMHWIKKIGNGKNMHIGERVNYIYTNAGTNSKYLVLVKKIEVNNEPQMIFAVTTLKPVDEAVEVMRNSLSVWIIFGLFIAAVTAVLLSKVITRSILNIMQVTTKMKNLDFSQKCLVQSGDEVGMLAANINDMSEKLDNTIKELVAANQKLTDDIEKERKIELARREFVAAVSHELKTPLAIIRAYSEGLADGISGAKHDKYLNVIIDETKKMDALVLDMLENSRLEAGVQKLNIKQYDLASMTEKIVSRFRNGMDDRNIEFIYENNEGAVTAEFDRGMLEQVMNNFISNAVRHTPDGGKIYIRLKKDNVGTMFSVENEGSHIDEKVIEKVWDRFYKVDKARERSSGGTGLGLSIAKNILILHKAKYGVKNTDTGVMFWFRLKK